MPSGIPFRNIYIPSLSAISRPLGLVATPPILVCDPVAGLVEVPCVKRNVGGAVNALAAADMALAGIASHIPVDQVIDAMGEVGMKMDVSLRETSMGGVATSPKGLEIAERLGM